MMPPDLRTSLLDLLYEVRGTDIKLIMGGGYGIYLRTERIRRSGERTLLEALPEARSTNDLDVFLRPELLIDSEKLKPLSIALATLGYSPIPSARNYQFVKPGPGGTEAGSIKIDILTGPEARFKGTNVKVDNRRISPRPSVSLHAHPANEAVTLEEGLRSYSLDGSRGTGERWDGEVFLPHPYTFLMMKLFAFKDRCNDADKEFGRYHALDMYSIIATTTKTEWEEALDLRERYCADDSVIEAGELMREYFSTSASLGIIRLKESPYFSPQLQLLDCISALLELFPARS